MNGFQREREREGGKGGREGGRERGSEGGRKRERETLLGINVHNAQAEWERDWEKVAERGAGGRFIHG